MASAGRRTLLPDARLPNSGAVGRLRPSESGDPEIDTEYPGESHLVFWRARLTKPNSFVYVMQVPGEDIFKVGYSTDPFYRLATLRRRYPGLRLRYVYPAPKRFEGRLHGRGGDCRAWSCDRGEEWFYADDEDGEQFLLFLHGLAYAMVDDYDGSGEPPPLPAFDQARSPEETQRLRRAIEKWILDGFGGSTDLFNEWNDFDVTDSEFTDELERMRATGEYYCFFEAADGVPRGPRPKSFVKLGHKHRYGGPMAEHAR